MFTPLKTLDLRQGDVWKVWHHSAVFASREHIYFFSVPCRQLSGDRCTWTTNTLSFTKVWLQITLLALYSFKYMYVQQRPAMICWSLIIDLENQSHNYWYIMLWSHLFHYTKFIINVQQLRKWLEKTDSLLLDSQTEWRKIMCIHNYKVDLNIVRE
jgi:hypothetical protein